MAALPSPLLFFRISRSACCCSRLFSTNQGLQAGQKWRISSSNMVAVTSIANVNIYYSQGQAPDGLRYGPLTDVPDWSYSDGRPAPETKRRRKRMRNRLDVAQRITQLLSEVEEAKNKPSDETDEKNNTENVEKK